MVLIKISPPAFRIILYFVQLSPPIHHLVKQLSVFRNYYCIIQDQILETMFKSIVKKVISMNKSFKNPVKITGKQFRQKCQKITKQCPLLSSSVYFTTHLPLIMQNQHIVPVLTQKIEIIQEGIKKNPSLEMQLASIILSITQQDGLLFIFIKLWVNAFCIFELQKIVDEYENIQKKGNTDLKMGEYEKQKGKRVQNFFHKQFFLLCFFIHHLCLYLYSQGLQRQGKQVLNRQLFLLIRNNITAVRNFSSVHQIFLHHINCQKINFNEVQIQLNMKDLGKICQINKIPAPFIQSMNLLNQFYKTAEIGKKLKKSKELIQKVKQEMLQYRIINKMSKDYLFCADDVLSALTFVMWRLRKNIFGACIYVETVLCCEFQQISQERLIEQLDKFGDVTRYSFDTLKGVTKIGLLAAQKIYSLN